MKQKSRLTDGLIRTLFISAGAVAAILFSLHGQADVLPPLALGGLLGACIVTGVGGSTDEQQ